MRATYLALSLVVIATIGSVVLASCAETATSPAKPVATMTNVHLYYHTPTDPEMLDCRAVAPVTRAVPTSDATPTGVLRLLTAGPTAADRAAGFTSVFSEATKDIIRSVRIEDDIAYVDLTDIRKTLTSVSASCGSAAFLSSIEETVYNNVPGVMEVRYAIRSDPAAFYEFIQVGCPPAGEPAGRCDPTPWQGVKK